MTALGAPAYAVLLKIGAAGGDLRIWTGIGDLEIQTDGIDAVGGPYQGIGLLSSVPPLRQLVGGAAERLEFSLAVADGPVFDLADDEADDIINAPVDLGLVFFDADWQLTGPAAWLWAGSADVPSIGQSSDEAQITRSITLSVGTALTDRTRPVLTYFTDADQRRRSPTDRFCERVAGYTGTHTIKWPA